MAETRGTPLSWGPAPRGGRARGVGGTGGEVTSGDQDTPTPRLASSDISLFKSVSFAASRYPVIPP